MKSIPLHNFLPNMLTIASVCSGLSGIRYALDGKWEVAAILVVIAGLLDLFDGRLARILGVSTDFGAQLDSLADFVNYGIVPPVIIYLWSLKHITIKGLGWGFVLFFAICCLIRLARFNTDLDDEDDSPDNNTTSIKKNKPKEPSAFVGMPSTVGGSLLLLPLIFDIEFSSNIINHPICIGIYSFVLALLMASKLPTFSTKKMSIPRNRGWIFMIAAGTFVCFMVMQPWLTIIFISLSYIILIPLYAIYYYKHL